MRWTLTIIGAIGLTLSATAWAISLPGLHWGRPGVLSVHLVDGMLNAENIAYTDDGWRFMNRPIAWSNVRFWPPREIWERYSDPQYRRYWNLCLPLWMPAAAFGGMLLAGSWPRSRRKPGVCRRCGYDLTGNVSGRCPECGETAKA